MMFEHLLQPIQIGPAVIRNRVFVSAHHTNYAHQGKASERLTAYYAARARGGVGLIISEPVSVDPTTRHMHNIIHLWDEDSVPGLRQMTDAVHSHGGKIFCQLLHSGRQQDAPMAPGGPVAPSPIPCPAHRHVPHELSRGEIGGLVEAFADAADRAARADFDGVEIHCAHGYLIEQFLSPWTNQRTDEYGGSLQNRLRFAREIIHAVRARVGTRIAVGARVNVAEAVPGGLSDAECDEIAIALAEAGLDYISMSAGLHITPDDTIPAMGSPFGLLADRSASVKGRVRIPVLTSHRIKTPETAEAILAAGKADMVNMARAHIADPDLLTKAQQGRLTEIRPCIGCIQGCRAQIGVGLPMGCLVNPAAGREREYALTPAPRPKRIAVVGGGIAGMQAAIVLRQRDHQVELFESSERLGGMALAAAALPGRSEFGEFVTWATGELMRLAVTVRVGTPFDLGQAGNYEAVIIATGAEYPNPVPNEDWKIPQFGLTAALAYRPAAGRTVLIVDRGDYHNKALLLAERYAELGARPIVLSQGIAVANDLDPVNRRAILSRLRDKGGRILSFGQLLKVDGGAAYLDHEGWQMTVPDVDAMVVVDYPVARTGLREELVRRFPDLEVHVAGDAYAPRGGVEAVHDGYRVGMSL